MTSSCNASLGRYTKETSILSQYQGIQYGLTLVYSRRLRDIESRLYQPKLDKPAYASHSLTPTIKRVSLLSIRSRCQSIFCSYNRRSKPNAATPPHPTDLPFLRGPFELLVHDDVTGESFCFSWSCETDAFIGCNGLGCQSVVLLDLMLYVQNCPTEKYTFNVHEMLHRTEWTKKPRSCVCSSPQGFFRAGSLYLHVDNKPWGKLHSDLGSSNLATGAARTCHAQRLPY
jgi:hypothetical protein